MRWRSARRRRPQGGKPEHHAPIPAVLDPIRFAGRPRNSACQITHSHHAFTSIVVHLDHENCLEVVMLRGPAEQVRAFADSIIAETGVRHGCLNLIPVELTQGGHRHDHDHGHGTPHLHSRPKV